MYEGALGNGPHLMQGREVPGERRLHPALALALALTLTLTLTLAQALAQALAKPEL